MLYFAYGSNMNLNRLKTRVNSYEVKGFAILNNYELIFNKISKKIQRYHLRI